MSHNTKKHIVIIGHGAIGLLWGHQLIEAGHQVTLLSRRQILPSSHQHLVSQSGLEYAHQLVFSNQLPKFYDLILVTTKAYQVRDALIPLLKEVTAPLMLMHNGMGTVDIIPFNTSHKIILATTTHGALKEGNTLTHTGLGKTIIGNYQKVDISELTHWQQLLNEALPRVEVHPHIQQPLLLKLAINSVINPLTAIHQCKNGELLNIEFDIQINKLINESQQVISQLDLNWPHTEASLKEIILNVAAATAKNYSSMAQDIKYNRPTEIEFINGYLISQGDKLGINLQEHNKLTNQLIALSNKIL